MTAVVVLVLRRQVLPGQTPVAVLRIDVQRKMLCVE